MRTVIEPFRIKSVESLKFTSREERVEILQRAGYNLFAVKADDVIIDLLTDSGTAALSNEQWAAMMRADESYAGCKSFYRFRDAVREIFGFVEVIPVHQGRAGERFLFSKLVEPGDIIPSNTHFDTTRANLEVIGARAMDLPCSDSYDTSSEYPFKGDIDLAAVSALLEEVGEKVPFGMLTVTNNARRGQPVSLDNIRKYSKLLHDAGIPLYIDAARFAENAYLNKMRFPDCRNLSIPEIVRQTFEHADGCLMSAKKDGLSNMGGFIALNDAKLAADLRTAEILTEGFPTYGGLSGRDLESVAVGLFEAMSEDYLHYRTLSAEYLARGLTSMGVPIATPPGIHAIYIDAAQFLPHIPAHEFPGQALACELFVEAGVRTCEIGTVMFGKTDPKTHQEIPALEELVRLALPRRVYTQSHFDYVIEAVANVWQRRHSIGGMRFVSKEPALRHFTAVFEPCNVKESLLKI